MSALPTGTVTFLFTDLEQSTRSWEDDRSAMEEALARHDAIIRSSMDERGGYVFASGGDGFAVSFARTQDALDAAGAAQRALGSEQWPGGLRMRVRMGIHAGEAHERDANYFGPTVNRAARVMEAAHGGQILLTDAAATAVGSDAFVDHGRHWLKDLPTQERLWEVVTDPSAEFPPLRTMGSGAATNVPPPDEALVGRDDDVEALRTLLADHRLVTAVGVGGIGKTRLALDVARTRLQDFADGVWWCELAPVGEPEAVAHAVAKVLGARQHPGRSMVDSIAEFCRRRDVLLVLDNCEHVLDAAGDLVDALLAVAPGARVLATSREALGCRAEQTYPLASLAVRGTDSPAVELFLRRASEVAPRRQWDDVDTAAIERICRRLDGMPLAIELAAGRVRSLAPAQIEQRLDDAFRVLRGGRRSIERHRTLGAAIEWSYRLLDDLGAMLFERLSVFAGGFDLEGAEAVCSGDDSIDEGEVADLLEDLVTKSLVVAEPGHRGTTRYRLLEPLRQYAEDRLATRGEAGAVRDQHAAYFAEWAERWAERCWSDELSARIELEAEFANLRAAVAWAVETDAVDLGMRVVGAVGRVQGPYLLLEMGDWAERVLSLAGAASHPLGPLVAWHAASAYWWRGEPAVAAEFCARGTAMQHYDPSSYAPNQLIAVLHMAQGDIDAARAVMARVDTSVREAVTVPWAWTGLDSAAPRELVETLRSHEASTGSEVVGIMADQAEAFRASREQDFLRAAELTRRSISRAAELAARYFVHMSVGLLGTTAARIGDLSPRDLELVRTSLREQRDAGQEVDQWLVLVTAAAAMKQHDRTDLATRIYRGLLSSVWAATPNIELLRQMLFADDADAAAAAADGPTLELGELVDAVLAEISTILAAA